MSTRHTVTAGEHAPGIALRYGFENFRTVWDDPANADLREARPNPMVLLPGDVLVIPAVVRRAEVKPTTQRHRFVLHRARLTLRLKLHAPMGPPCPGAGCTLHVEGESRAMTTDGAGVVERPVERGTRAGVLGFNGLRVPIAIGHLDPVDSLSGVQGRLANLGYYTGDVGDDEDADLLRLAIEEFQLEQGAAVDGRADSVRGLLLTVHGC